MIEDDQDDQEIFLLALKDAFPGAGCWIAENCSQALERMKKKFAPVPDYIFMDWNLPLLEAEECIRQIQFSGLHNACVFVISGTAPPVNLEKLQQLGIKKVLKKQASVRLLAKELHDVIKSQWL